MKKLVQELEMTRARLVRDRWDHINSPNPSFSKRRVFTVQIKALDKEIARWKGK